MKASTLKKLRQGIFRKRKLRVGWDPANKTLGRTASPAVTKKVRSFQSIKERETFTKKRWATRPLLILPSSRSLYLHPSHNGSPSASSIPGEHVFRKSPFLGLVKTVFKNSSPSPPEVWAHTGRPMNDGGRGPLGRWTPGGQRRPNEDGSQVVSLRESQNRASHRRTSLMAAEATRPVALLRPKRFKKKKKKKNLWTLLPGVSVGWGKQMLTNESSCSPGPTPAAFRPLLWGWWGFLSGSEKGWRARW